MKNIDEFYNLPIKESLENAKKSLEKVLSKYTQGFEIYIDDSGEEDVLIISIDELIKGGAEYPDLDKAINNVTKKYKLKKDSSSNDSVVFLTEGVSYMPEYQVYGKLSVLLRKYKSEDAAYKDSEKLAKKLGYSQDAVEFGIDLDYVATRNIDKLQSRKKRNKLHGSGDNR